VVRISATVSGEQVKLQVVDNGVGMSEETLGKLFEPYFSTKIGHGGTGLGMAIVRNLTTKTLGGSIEVQSTFGSGTNVTISLPLAAPDGSANQVVSAQALPQ
jgi:two-component system NtrC family sensor kinase